MAQPSPTRTALLALPLALVLAACGGGDSSSGPAGVSGVVALPAALELLAGDTSPLAAVVLPNPGVDQAVVWSSADTTVARVAGGGTSWTVRGVSRGTTQLTVASVQDPSKSTTVAVTVAEPAMLQFLDGSALWNSTSVLSATTELLNIGDLPATGVTLEIHYPIGQVGWLTATPASAAPFDVPAGGSIAVTFTGDLTGLDPGLYVAEVDPTDAVGLLFAGNPFTVALSIP